MGYIIELRKYVNRLHILSTRGNFTGKRDLVDKDKDVMWDKTGFEENMISYDVV
jgi:hypothetical protein